MATLTQKERMVLKDQLGHEEVCIRKYKEYASSAKDQKVRNMFNEFAQEEQQHYDTIDGFLQGNGAQSTYSAGQTGTHIGTRMSSQGMSGQSSRSMGGQTTWGGSQAGSQTTARATSQTGSASSGTNGQPTNLASGNGSQGDKHLLNDMLMTEKYVSGAYDTAIFESADPEVRQSLQSIQDDEQRHGEAIFNYMKENGMYQQQ